MKSKLFILAILILLYFAWMKSKKAGIPVVTPPVSTDPAIVITNAGTGQQFQNANSGTINANAGLFAQAS